MDEFNGSEDRKAYREIDENSEEETPEKSDAPAVNVAYGAEYLDPDAVHHSRGGSHYEFKEKGRNGEHEQKNCQPAVQCPHRAFQIGCVFNGGRRTFGEKRFSGFREIGKYLGNGAGDGGFSGRGGLAFPASGAEESSRLKFVSAGDAERILRLRLLAFINF